MKILGTCLMLSLLVGVFTPAAPSRAAALLTDPIPWLSGSTVADAPHTSTASGVDGAISPGEYASAHRLAYRVNGGVMEVYIQQNSSSLMIAMDCPDQSPYIFRTGGVGPALQVFLDTDDDGASLPQPDDFLFTVSKGNTTSVRIGDGSYWISAANDDWLGAATTTPTGWQAEFSIPFTKLGILSPSSEVLGFAVAEVWPTTWPYDWYWPASAFFDNPSSWGTLISTSHWSSFYWKSASWQDYAPGGMPDFDQKQLNWIVESPSGLIWTHSAPAAAANSLWWFDSRFEAAAKAPPLLSDTYRLFKTYYPTLDDHDYPNASALIIDLAENYLNTNKLAAGTSVTDLFEGLRAFLKKTSFYDSYRVSLAKKPGFGWVANEIKRSEDVILLLGFWQEDGHGSFVRVGGHYVTAAGVDLENQKIAFSDPFLDATEEGLTGGEVGSGWLLPHSPIPGHSADLHNDAGNLSHDIYEIEQAVAPSGFWSAAC